MDRQTIQEIVAKIETEKKEEGAMIQEIIAKIESKKKEEVEMIQGIVAKLETKFAEKPTGEKDESVGRKNTGMEFRATDSKDVKKQENSETEENASKDENDNILPSIPDYEDLADTQAAKPTDVKNHEEDTPKDTVDRNVDVKNHGQVKNNEKVEDNEEMKDNEKVDQVIDSPQVEEPRGAKEVMVSMRPRLGRGRGRKVLVARSALSPNKTVV